MEILTDPQTRALKGGGCTCKKGGYVSCNTNNDSGGNTGGGTDITIDPIQLHCLVLIRKNCF